jgi:multidrug resistance efflux pump
MVRATHVAVFLTGLGVISLFCDRVPAQKENEAKNLVRVASPRDGIVTAVMVKEGQAIKKDDLLVRVDDRIARAKVEIARAKMGAAKADLDVAEKTREEAKHRYEVATQLHKRQAISREELEAARMTFERYKGEAASKAESVKVAEGEVHLAEVVLDQHTIRSPIDGIVQSVAVKPGEAARRLEVVVTIRSSDK